MNINNENKTTNQSVLKTVNNTLEGNENEIEILDALEDNDDVIVGLNTGTVTGAEQNTNSDENQMDQNSGSTKRRREESQDEESQDETVSKRKQIDISDAIWERRITRSQQKQKPIAKQQEQDLFTWVTGSVKCRGNPFDKFEELSIDENNKLNELRQRTRTTLTKDEKRLLNSLLTRYHVHMVLKVSLDKFKLKATQQSANDLYRHILYHYLSTTDNLTSNQGIALDELEKLIFSDDAVSSDTKKVEKKGIEDKYKVAVNQLKKLIKSNSLQIQRGKGGIFPHEIYNLFYNML